VRAVVYRRYGSPDVLKIEEVGKPIPLTNELLIKIQATTVTPQDVKFRSGGTIAARLAAGLLRPNKKILGIFIDSHFMEFYNHQKLLASEGIIVWGNIIQANEKLFIEGNKDYPAAIIYSLDPKMDGIPEVLQTASTSLFSVKGKRTDPELQIFSDKLADEMVRDWKIPIPTKLTEGIQCYYITTMVIRKHLPGGYLANSLFPFLVCPSKTDVGMILPEEYWAPEFKEKYWYS